MVKKQYRVDIHNPTALFILLLMQFLDWQMFLPPAIDVQKREDGKARRLK